MLSKIPGRDLFIPHGKVGEFMKHFRKITERQVRAAGFTLVEMLVVIGIIALVLGIILPTLAGARRQSRILQCASNIRQLASGMILYAAENQGKFPPNTYLTSPGQYWSDADRLGEIIPTPAANLKPDKTVYICPDDVDARQSYAVNLWASSAVDPTFLTAPLRGQIWNSNVQSGAEMILMAEAWSYQGSAATGWSAPATIGYAGDSASQRFGGEGGISTLVNAGRWGEVNCELPFMRHRAQDGSGTQPVGRINIAFADGHVEFRSNDSFVDPGTGVTQGNCFWSPLDLP